MTTAMATPGRTWSTWHDVPAMVAAPANLKRTITIALVIGTSFVAMNQLGVILSGDATLIVWLKAGLTYLTPFCVSNVGMLSATHRRADEG
ncbi:MAG: nitrate/nitrite transporter NrtS [Candidatus Limnocylindria bacterium]